MQMQGVSLPRFHDNTDKVYPCTFIGIKDIERLSMSPKYPHIFSVKTYWIRIPNEIMSGTL